MGNIERVRNIAKKFGQFGRSEPVEAPARAYRYDDRKNDDHAHCIVNAIHPYMVLVTDAWDAQRNDDEGAGPPECIFNMDEFAAPAKQHTREKRVQYPGESDKQLRAVKRPAADEVALGAGNRVSNHHAAGKGYEYGEQQFREPPDDHGI